MLGGHHLSAAWNDEPHAKTTLDASNMRLILRYSDIA